MNVPTIETRIVRKLAQAAIASGFTVTVFDGEEYVLKYSTDIEAIMGAVASTDEDVLLFHHPKGPEGLRERIGWVSLVWGNDSEVLSDNTVSEEMTGLMQPVEAWIEAGCPDELPPAAIPADPALLRYVVFQVVASTPAGEPVYSVADIIEPTPKYRGKLLRSARKIAGPRGYVLVGRAGAEWVQDHARRIAGVY